MKYELPMKNAMPAAGAPTMNSLEMVDYINADRKSKAEAAGLKFPCKRFTKIQHKHILAKAPKVLGEEHSAKFLAQYKDSTGRELPCYNFPKREACLMAMSYSYELQAQVFDYMTVLEGNSGADLNLLDLSGLTEMTIQQMQDRVTQAENFSYTEHGQKGSGLMNLRKKEKKAIKKAERMVKELIQFSICDLGDFPDVACA